MIKTNPSTTTKTIFNLPVADLKDHPSLGHVTMLPALADYFKDNHHGDTARADKALEMRRDCDAVLISVKENGVLEPIKVIQNPDGGWWVVDGRHRLHAARAAGLETIPAEDVSDAGFESFITESVLGRRHLTKRARAHFYVLLHPEIFENRPFGRPKKIKSPQNGDFLTLPEMARRAGVSETLMVDVITNEKKFQESPELRAANQPGIWAGNDTGTNAGVAGSLLKGKARPVGTIEGVNKLYGRVLYQLKEHSNWMQDKNAHAAFKVATKEFAAAMPPAARAELRAALDAVEEKGQPS